MINMFAEIEKYRLIRTNESNRSIIRTALEQYRNIVTMHLYTAKDYSAEYHDIELLEIDEILENLGED